MDKLPPAAARLAERLRECPSDGIVERLGQHEARAKDLRAQLAGAWPACQATLEALIAEVAAERERVYDGAIAFIESLERLVKRAGAVLEGLSPGLTDGSRGLLQVALGAKAMRDAIVDGVPPWAGRGAEFVAGLVEREGANLREIYPGFVQALRGILIPEIEKREEVAAQFGAKAASIAPMAIKALNGCYEEWAVRLATMTALAERHGVHDVPTRARGAVESGLEDAREVQDAASEEVVLMLQSAGSHIGALTAVGQDLNRETSEALGAIDERVAALADALEAATGGLEEAATRLSVYTTGMIP